MTGPQPLSARRRASLDPHRFGGAGACPVRSHSTPTQRTPADRAGIAESSRPHCLGGTSAGVGDATSAAFSLAEARAVFADITTHPDATLDAAARVLSCSPDHCDAALGREWLRLREREAICN